MVGSVVQGGVESSCRCRSRCATVSGSLSCYRAIVGITETCNSRTTRLNPEEGAGSGAADWTWPETHENHEMSALLNGGSGFGVMMEEGLRRNGLFCVLIPIGR